jgi:hypothetical protein
VVGNEFARLHFNIMIQSLLAFGVEDLTIEDLYLRVQTPLHDTLAEIQEYVEENKNEINALSMFI